MNDIYEIVLEFHAGTWVDEAKKQAHEVAEMFPDAIVRFNFNGYTYTHKHIPPVPATYEYTKEPNGE